jgi:hypothetical protein
MKGAVIGVTGNFDRQILSTAVRKAGGRVDALVHKNLHYVSCLSPTLLQELDSSLVHQSMHGEGPCVRH